MSLTNMLRDGNMSSALAQYRTQNKQPLEKKYKLITLNETKYLPALLLHAEKFIGELCFSSPAALKILIKSNYSWDIHKHFDKTTPYKFDVFTMQDATNIAQKNVKQTEDQEAGPNVAGPSKNKEMIVTLSPPVTEDQVIRKQSAFRI